MAWTSEQEKAIFTRIKTDKVNAIISAGAGSGKTSVLTEHVIELIKSGIHVDELLVLTFTNDAANEMKTRIREALKKANLQDELELLDSSDICTFDALNLSLVKKYHYLLKISPDVQVVDSALINAKKIKIIDEIFDEYYELQDEKFINLIKTFFIKSKDDRDLKERILNISDKLDLKLDKEHYLNNYIKDYFSEEKIEEFLKDYDNFVLEKLDIITELMSELSYEVDTKYMDDLNDSISNLMNSKTFEDVKNNLNIKLPSISSSYGKKASKIKETINDIIKKELPKLVEFSKVELKDNYVSTKEYVEVIIDIINKLDKRLYEFKYQNDVYEFNDIASLSINILKNHNEIKQELQDKYKEIIIDEYQDTSDIQDEFIKQIENKNVYVVGDIKQAIYGFRNANPEIFKKKYDLYSDNVEGIKQDLHGNFRSRKEVIGVINEIFNIIMTEKCGGADYLKDHNMDPINEEFINNKIDNQEYGLKVLEYEKNKEYSNEEIEAFIIAYDIQNKINNKYQIFDKGFRNVNYSDFAILLENKTAFNTYLKIFTDKGIPVVQTKDIVINEEDEIFLIKNSIKLILKIRNNIIDQEFKYTFTSIARSYLFNMDDNTIYQTITNNTYNETELYNKAKVISNDLDSITLTNLVNIILKEFNFYTNIITTNNIEQSLLRIDSIKKYASDLEKLGLSISEFVSYIEELIDYKINLKQKLENNGNGVKMMTIHASKGLQFPICYFADLTREFNLDNINKRFLFDKKYGVVTPCFKEGIRDIFTKTLLRKKYIDQEISEKTRLFYVALTRAKEDMIIVRPHIDKIVINKECMLDILRPANKIIDKYIDFTFDINDVCINKTYRYGKKKSIIIPTISKKINEININIDKEVLSKNKYSKNQNNLINNSTKKELEYGTLLHEYFELDNFNNPIKETTKKFLKYFNFDKAINIIKEYEFIDEDNHGIIDLLIEYEDYIDIIDYKTKNINDGDYEKQLGGYKTYIEKITNKKIDTYLYSIKDDMLEKV